MSAPQKTPEQTYVQQDGPVFMSGNQAYLRLTFEQHRRDREAGLNTAGFISGYRGSPFGHFDQDAKRVGKALAARNIKFNPGVNEAMAATAVWGSQQIDFFNSSKFDGVFGLWYGKGPGVDHAADALHHGNLWGTHKNGGVVMAVGDDPMSRSSSIQQQSEHVLSGLCIPVFHASSVQDIYDYGLIGYQLSRYAGVWVAVKSVSDIAESWYMVDVDPARTRTVLPDDFDIPDCGVHIRWPDKSVDQDYRMTAARIPAVKAFVRTNRLNKVTHDASKRRLGIVSAGKSYLDTLEALEDLGIDQQQRDALGLAVFKVACIWPLEESLLREFAATVDELIVLEESRPFLETQVKDVLYDMPVELRPRVLGKRDHDGKEQLPSNGELTPSMIARVLVNWFGKDNATESMQQWMQVLDNTDTEIAVPRENVDRTPYFCSGCPHNSSTKVPEGANQLIGIGCHYLVHLMERDGVSYTQMGGEGATWAGAAPFVDQQHAFVNLGDGTYYHSGSVAIRQAIASNINITYKILFNDAVAMTGGQSFDGPLSVEAITHEMKAEGATRVVVVSADPGKFDKHRFAAGTDLYHRDDLIKVQKELEATPGVTVLIYEQTCATELRRRRKSGQAEDPAKRAYINYRLCEGCGDCGEASNCLSVQPVETELGRKRIIDQSACNKDFSCVNGFCPSFVTIEGGDLAKGKGIEIAEDMFTDLPQPAVASSEGVFGALVCGIGGTGVVTISSLMGEAAQSEGKASQVLDLTGMAQKFGAVYCHLKIGDSVDDLNATRLSRGKANLLIGADIVTSASNEGLSRLRRDVTQAVVNEHETVTGAFTRDGDFHIPVKAMREAIERFTGKGNAHFFDSTDVALRLTGDTIGANIMLLGYACQMGWLPVKLESLESAIAKNGVAVPYNLRAFKLGRLMAHNPQQIEKLMEQGFPTPEWRILSDNVDQMIERRERDLIAYQDKKYAASFRELVERVRRAETAIQQDSIALTEAVTRSLYKLMAYKDEYEVARLYTDGAWLANIKRQFQGDFKLKFHMAPPLLSKRDPETGHLKKREFGPWMYGALKLLSRLKGLRGTKLDLFGYSEERKQERALIIEYRKRIEKLIVNLSTDNLQTAIAIAAVPQQIKGFGHVKERNLAQAKERWAMLEERFDNPARHIQAVQIMEPELVD
ncbi:indolepyruvate ferredoxin oxidoreductase family protein [Marinobacterium sediminicola]|uniref:Indolepyruvate ferredoxin oxidoreductase n=1 Tax=Marinobacterium sediminicola TaxID=518898 RepID=A0ABY1RZ06_9GAMM|nr:indolepyruvate ferredoxin oxidoreductase family protein [Marinobacterium sediminicola]ULG68058.1 indolepyruvate ferredoxin oxidoreductase family protein [Marinobacterium sediminicola]SMR73432.1 indolepyruvate ferredoxin oxidoreductase [Marinobacterium sediminicola]